MRKIVNHHNPRALAFHVLTGETYVGGRRRPPPSALNRELGPAVDDALGRAIHGDPTGHMLTAGQIVSAESAFGSGSNAFLLNPDGSVLASLGTCFSACTAIGKTLSTTGTYTFVLVEPAGSSGNATLSLTSNTTNPAM